MFCRVVWQVFCVAGFCVAGFCVAGFLCGRVLHCRRSRCKSSVCKGTFHLLYIHKIHTAIHQIFYIAGCHLNVLHALLPSKCLLRLVLPLILLGMPIKVSVVIKVSLQQEANELMLGSLQSKMDILILFQTHVYRHSSS